MNMLRMYLRVRFLSEYFLACSRSVKYNKIYLGQKIKHILPFSKWQNYPMLPCRHNVIETLLDSKQRIYHLLTLLMEILFSII